MTKLFLPIAVLFLLIVNTPLTYAATTPTTPDCQPIYGGGQSCLQGEELSVNLQIKNPTINNYVDNLSATQTTFTPSQTVNYKLTVKNTVNRDLSKITVTVIFPQQVLYASGGGTYDAKTRKLTYSVDKLAQNDSKVFYVNGKINGRETFSGQGIICTFTQAIVTVDNKNSQDNSQFCVNTAVVATGSTINRPGTTKGGLAVYPPSRTKNTPQTGPESLALIGLLPAAGLGFWLRRKTAM